MSDAYSWDGDSALKAQQGVHDASIHVKTFVLDQLRRVAFPEMPAGVRSQVEGGIAAVIGLVQTAVASNTAAAQAIRNKNVELGNPNDGLSHWDSFLINHTDFLDGMPSVMGVSVEGNAGSYNGVGGGASVEEGYLWDGQHLYHYVTPAASAGVGGGTGAMGTFNIVWSDNARTPMDIEGTFDTTTMTEGGLGVGGLQSQSFGTGQDGQPVEFEHYGVGIATPGPSGSLSVSPEGFNYTFVEQVHWYDVIPGL